MATENRSGLKEFLASISTIKGDLSNITAPPFLLASQSTVQFPAYWAENPPLFVAPSKESDPLKRTVLVLKWFLAALKRQQYAGRDPSDGVKKPLNAFLGEVFLANWEDDEGETRIVSEQVSHHPPVTACYLWNRKWGIHAEGFARQSITFSGSVNIKQSGFALLHIDKYDESYLIPLPNIRVAGLLSGTPYPEITGSYSIISSNGFSADIDFSGKKMLGLSGKKNSFTASIHSSDDSKGEALYTAEGTWSESFVIRQGDGTEIDCYDCNTAPLPSMKTDPIEQQDPWESQKAWSEVTSALSRGDMQAVADAKSLIEEGQRSMRADEGKTGAQWEPIFFRHVSEDSNYSRLAAGNPSVGFVGRDSGFWKYNFKNKGLPSKPFHGKLRPDNKQLGDSQPADETNQQLHETCKLDSQPHGSSPSISRNDWRPGDAGSIKEQPNNTVTRSPYSLQPIDPRVNTPVEYQG